MPTTKNTKFFLIQHGECVVEKNVVIEVENPYDRSKPISENTQPIQVAVIGILIIYYIKCINFVKDKE